MPADTLIYVSYCLSQEQFTVEVPSASDPTKLYTVRHEALTPFESERQGGAETGFTCTCKGFQFRAKCGHIAQVKAARVYCGWDEVDSENTWKWKPGLTEPGTNARLCPRCGGPCGVRKELV